MAKGKRRPVGETLGGILVGFDQQVFRTTPPAQELVRKGQPVRGVSGEDGGDLEVLFPDDLEGESPAGADDGGLAPKPQDGPSGP
jgi:hypothetical protein